MTFGTTRICNLGKSFAITALSVLANEHFALFAVNFKKILSADRALVLGGIFVVVLCIGNYNL